MLVSLFQIRRQHIFDPFHECADSARQIAPMCYDEGHGERPATKIWYDLHKRSTGLSRLWGIMRLWQRSGLHWRFGQIDAPTQRRTCRCRLRNGPGAAESVADPVLWTQVWVKRLAGSRLAPRRDGRGGGCAVHFSRSAIRYCSARRTGGRRPSRRRWSGRCGHGRPAP